MGTEARPSGTVIRDVGQRRIDRVAPRLGRALPTFDQRLPDLSHERP